MIPLCCLSYLGTKLPWELIRQQSDERADLSNCKSLSRSKLFLTCPFSLLLHLSLLLNIRWILHLQASSKSGCSDREKLVGQKIFSKYGELEILLCARRGGLTQKTARNCRLLAKGCGFFIPRENCMRGHIRYFRDWHRWCCMMRYNRHHRSTYIHNGLTDLIYLCKNHILYKRAIVLF